MRNLIRALPVNFNNLTPSGSSSSFPLLDLAKVYAVANATADLTGPMFGGLSTAERSEQSCWRVACWKRFTLSRNAKNIPGGVFVRCKVIRSGCVQSQTIKYHVVSLIVVGLSSTKTETKIQFPHFQIPKTIGEFFDNILETYPSLARPSTPKEYYAANKPLKGAAQAQRGLFYLKYLGLMEDPERGKYKPTSAGMVIGQHLKAKRAEEAKRSWQKLLIEHPIFARLKDYFKEEGVGTGKGFGDYLSKHGADVDQKYVKTGGQKLCMLFASKGLIKYKENEDTFTLEDVKAIPVPGSGQPMASRPEENLPPGSAMTYHIEININVDENTPPDLAAKLFEFYWTTRKKPDSGKK